jgi:hypothetical protein
MEISCSIPLQTNAYSARDGRDGDRFSLPGRPLRALQWKDGREREREREKRGDFPDVFYYYLVAETGEEAANNGDGDGDGDGDGEKERWRSVDSVYICIYRIASPGKSQKPAGEKKKPQNRKNESEDRHGIPDR